MKARTEEQRERDRARSRAWHVRQRLLVEAWRDWRGFDGPTVIGALYDAIWALELPRIERVDSASVRMVLFAMAKHLHSLKLQSRDYRVWPSAARIAELIDRNERQVQRILGVLVQHRLVEVIRPGMRAGRNRPGRPTIYRLALERWPVRSLNGRDTRVATNGDLGMVATPGTDGDDTGVAESDGDDTGVAEDRMVATPVSPEAVNTGKLSIETGKPAREPGNARGARERDFQDGRPVATQLAFPPIVVARKPDAADQESPARERRFCGRCRIGYTIPPGELDVHDAHRAALAAAGSRS